MLGFTQYGCSSFSIDASSDPAKFQDDWPSGSPLIGAWSLIFAPNVLVCQVAPLVKWTFFGPKLIFTISGHPNRFSGSISTFLVNLKKIGQGHIFALSRDQVT